MLTNPLLCNGYKLGCSTNIARRMTDSDYVTMFPPDNMPKLVGWISVEGYETPSEVRFLEQSIFQQLLHKRIYPNREFFRDITIEEVANCIMSLQLVPKIHTEAPTDNGIKDKRIMNFSKISVKSFQVPILAKMKTYFDSNNRGKLILPCGYGKMYLALFLIRDKFDTAIVACPSLLLCQQFTEVAQKICLEYSIGLREGKKWIVITTYHSVAKCKDYNPELLIVDEAHHTCVTSKSDEEDSLFRSLLRFPTRKYLFMTATEKVLKHTEDNKETPWYSMNSNESYGDEIIKKDFSEAINEGIISDYRLAVVNSGDPIQIIAAAQQILGTKWMLTYHNNCKLAKDFQQQLNSVGIPTFYMDGDVSMNERMLIIQAFEQKPYSVLCSVDVLAEGISLPFVDSAYFVDPRGSEIDIIQRVGRCLRLHKYKSLATIILPENILEYAALLRSLIVHDPKAKNSIKRKIIGLGFHQTETRFNNLIDTLNITILGWRESQWQIKWEIAMKYEKEVNEIIMQTVQYEGINLGVWITNQKKIIKNNGIMSEERLNKLLQLNTIQQWKPDNFINQDQRKIKWEMKLSLCMEYETLHGIIQQKTIYKEVTIGGWMTHQKGAIQGKDHGQMNDEKLNKLLKLRTIYDWYKNFIQDCVWTEKCNQCIEYEKSKGPIVQKTMDGEFKMGYWINNQKAAIRGINTGIMNESRIKQLLRCVIFRDWYVLNQEKCLEKFRGFHLLNIQ
jgi:superfamily II DNA or RNA helicase